MSFMGQQRPIKSDIPIEENDTDSASVSFALANGHGYMLDSVTYQGAARLNLQHYLWREVFGYTIHPSVQLPDNPKLADVATGTGLWMIDVARDIPTAHIDGLDIDFTRAPPPEWLPRNVKLRHWDMFEDVPDDMVGKYDLVHVRLLILVLSGVDLSKPLANFFKLVKPGGYIQWDDLDSASTHIKRTDKAMDTPALEELRAACYASGRHSWIMDLPGLLTREGFQSANLSWFDETMELVRAFNDQHLMTMAEFAAQLTQTGQHEGAERFRSIIAQSYQECLRGAAISMPRITVVAHRPEA